MQSYASNKAVKDINKTTLQFYEGFTSMTVIYIFKNPTKNMVVDLTMHSVKKTTKEIFLSYECNQLTGTQWVSVSNLSNVVFSSLNATVRSSFTMILSKR